MARHNRLRSLQNTKDELRKLLGYHAEGLDEAPEPRPKAQIERDMDDITTGVSGLWSNLYTMDIADQLGAFGLYS